MLEIGSRRHKIFGHLGTFGHTGVCSTRLANPGHNPTLFVYFPNEKRRVIETHGSAVCIYVRGETHRGAAANYSKMHTHALLINTPSD